MIRIIDSNFFFQGLVIENLKISQFDIPVKMSAVISVNSVPFLLLSAVTSILIVLEGIVLIIHSRANSISGAETSSMYSLCGGVNLVLYYT